MEMLEKYGINEVADYTTYEDGQMKSFTLLSGETVDIKTKYGEFSGRIGVKIYPSGALASFEPAMPITIQTKIGEVVAFDQHAQGMGADFYSVRFDEDGELALLVTNSDVVVIDNETRERSIIFQQLRLDEATGEWTKLPVQVGFNEGEVVIDNGEMAVRYTLDKYRFMFLHDGYYTMKKCSPGGDCSGCGAECI